MIKSSLPNKRHSIDLSASSKKNHATICLNITPCAILQRTLMLKFPWLVQKRRIIKRFVYPWQLAFLFQNLILERETLTPHLPNPYALRGVPHAVWSDVIKHKHRILEILKKPGKQHYQGRQCKLNKNFTPINVYLVKFNSSSPRWCCKGSQGRFKCTKSGLGERSQCEQSKKRRHWEVISLPGKHSKPRTKSMMVQRTFVSRQFSEAVST